MEDSAIKSPARSPNTLDEILDEENQRVKRTDQEEELADISPIPIDDKQKLNQNIESPVNTLPSKNDNVEIFRNDEGSSLPDEKIDCISTKSPNQLVSENKEGIVGDLKGSSVSLSAILTDSVLSVMGKEKMTTKRLNSRASCKETAKNIVDKKKMGKTMPVKNTSRKVLAEKQIRSIRTCNQTGILLRSYRKKGTNIFGENSPLSNVQMSEQNEIEETPKNTTDFKNGVEFIDEKNFNPDKENILGELGQTSDPLSLGNEIQDAAKFRTKRTVSYESLSLMDKILIREHELLEKSIQIQSTHQTNDGTVLNNESKSLAKGSTDFMKNEIAPKKRYHRRKCSEPFKNERVQTRQSRSITLMQEKSDYECFSQVPNTATCVSLECDGGMENKVPVEESEYSIICTPDIDINDRVEETFSDENQNLAIGSLDKEKNNELGYNEDQHAVNFINSSPVDQTSPCKKNDCQSTASTNSRISPKETSCSTAKTKCLQLSKKRGQENADRNPKRKLRHVNAQAMPVYMNRIAVMKNENQSTSDVEESLLLSRTRNKRDKSSDTDRDKGRNSPVVIEIETQHCLNNIFLRSKSGKATDPKYSYLSNTDSEETLSNVESVPNSPAQEIWPKVAGKNLKLSNKCVKLNSGQSSTRRRDTSVVMHRIPTFVNHNTTETGNNIELTSVCKHKRSQPEISSSTLNCSSKRDKSELRYYVETLVSKNPSSVSASIEQNDESSVGNDDLGGPQETPWLRHYERPQKTHADIVKNVVEFEDNIKENSLRQNQKLHDQQKKDLKRTKKASKTSNADNSVSYNLQAAEGYSSSNRSGKHPQPANNRPFRKRGRPRKQDAQSSKINSEGHKKNGPSVSRAVPNGSGLTKLELERLFFKFLQHGHFGIDPRQPPIIIHNNDLYQHFSARMQCYDPRKYYMHPYNGETQSNAESKTYPYSQQHFSIDNDVNRFYPSNNSSSSELGHKLRTTNSDSRNFSNELVGQATYSRNMSPYKMHTNINSYTDSEKAVINTSSYNAIAHTNSVSNHMPSGYGTASNYHQNFYNNNANVMGNNPYSNSYCGIANSNGSMNDTNTSTAATNLSSTTNNFDDDFNFILSTQHQPQNSISCREIDINMSNGNTLSSNSINSMQNSPTNNVNRDWNFSSGNQHLDSVNGLLMDLNSMNSTNESGQAIHGNPDLNNVMNNSKSVMNEPNPWMNKSNNMNPPFPILPPWHASFPMYNSYLNNGNPYYNNILNPYAALTGFDHSNHPYSNMNSRTAMGINNENSWMQNILPGSDRHSTFNTTSTEFSNVNSDSLQENRLNQGMNLSLSSNTILPQTNSIELVNDINLVMGHGNRLNPNIEQPKEDPFAPIETDNNTIVQESSAIGYGEQICLPYSSEYKNDAQNLDFNNVEMVNNASNNTDNKQQSNLSQIQDYIKQRSDILESCINQSYSRTGPPSSEIVTELSDTQETEMSKLRQELADFTRQYSEDQTSPISQIPQEDERARKWYKAES